MTSLEILDRIQRRVLWLAAWMVHQANARPSVDGLKVGGHQASSASVVSLLTALYFDALRPDHVVATKAHASPAFYAIQYLRGRLSAAELQGLRVFGGLQAYPSRRKNPGIVDLSTGSMGLGAVAATFGGLASRYLADHGARVPPERFVVMVGDAELDEGNVWEALGEDVVRRLGNVLWIVDVNRQSLDRVVADGRPRQLAEMFRAGGWRVDELRWGRRLQACFARPGGERLRARLEGISNVEYQRLLRQPAGALRKALVADAAGGIDAALDRLLADVTDEALAGLVADVGGHDLALDPERVRGRRPRARSPLGDPGPHDQGVGLAVRRRSAQPHHGHERGADRGAARGARRRPWRGMGGVRAGYAGGRAHPGPARALHGAGVGDRSRPCRSRSTSRTRTSRRRRKRSVARSPGSAGCRPATPSSRCRPTSR